MEIFNDKSSIYIDNENISASWLFFTKIDMIEMILLFKELGKYWNLNFGIYEEFNYDINPKIDFLQKAFGKKKLSLFAKNRKENGSVNIKNENYYIDFVEINNVELYESFFDFLFDDFFYSNLLLKVTNKNYNDSLLNTKKDHFSSSKEFLNDYFQFDKPDIISNLIFGYTHDGKKVLLFLYNSDNKNVRNLFNSNLSKVEFDKIYKNTVLFRPFDVLMSIHKVGD